MEQTEIVKVTKRQNNVIAVLGAVCVAAIVTLVFLLSQGGKPEGPAARRSFTPPAFEENAVKGMPEVDPALGWSELSVRSGYTVHACGVLNVEEDGRVAVWGWNEPKNDVWIRLRLTDEDGNVLGQTGVLRAGEYVEYLQLDAVPELTTPVTLYVIGYEPDTYYSAGNLALNTELIVGDHMAIPD